MELIYLTPKKNKFKILGVLIGAISIFAISAFYLELDFVTFIQRGSEAGAVVSNFLVLNTQDIGEIITQLFVSVAMAIASLMIGILLSFIFAILGATNITPSKTLSIIIKSGVSVIRAIPSLVWILMIVASLGFGSLAGVVGLVFPTIGYLTKSFISSIEEVAEEMIETMKSTGASWLQLVFEGILPNVLQPFTTWIAIRLESNVAESISLGMVGAGGIGTVLSRAISSYNYGKITMCILVIFITMLVFELSMGQVKKKQVIG